MEMISVPDGPAAVGPYSPAVKTGNTIYFSGQVPFDPETGEVVGANIAEQTRSAMNNLKIVLEAAGLGMDDLVCMTVYLANFDDFAEFNAAYAECLGEHKPARVCLEVSRIAKDALLEIGAIAESK